MTKMLTFEPWTRVRDALESAYKEMGLEMVVTGPGSRSYPDDHWNIAGLVRRYVLTNEKANLGHVSCWTCKVDLDMGTLFRCLDCTLPLCAYCAKDHFGPNHQARADAAHPK